MGTHHGQREPASGRPGQAEYWFARLLEPDCSAAERTEFERWRDADPAHAAAWDALERLWRQSADAARHPALAAAAWRALHDAPATPWFHRWRSPRVWLPAATAALAALLVLALLPRWRAAREPAAAGTTYSTALGQQRSIRLPDGTTITLDTQSSLAVRYDERERRVDLLRGRAQFAVRANPRRPFVVHVQNGTVTDIGTVFQVRTGDDCTGVTLIEGQLDIAASAPDRATRHVSLESGRRLWFDRTGRISPAQPADLQAAEGWTKGKLFVHDWRLPELLDEMNRYNRLQIRIGDPALEAIRVSGAFNTHDPQTMLQLLQQGWPIRIRHDADDQVVLLAADHAQT
jgi:transmembrane sensor